MEKSSPEMCAISVIFKPLPKINDHPGGQKFAQSGHPAANITAQFPEENRAAVEIGRYLYFEITRLTSKSDICM
jgi:hypothetical protein